MFQNLSWPDGRKIHRSCPACLNGEYVLRFTKADYSYVRCLKCGTVYINPIPEVGCLEINYNQLSFDYFLQKRKRVIDFFPNRYSRELAVLTKAHAKGRLLDVGCATGSFLVAARQDGYADVTGIDIAEPSVHFAQEMGLNAVHGDFSREVFDAGSFDVVTMWATLEHLPSPSRFVEEAFRILKPGGVLAVSVPNYRSLSTRLLGPKYRYIGLAHLNYFSAQTLKLLLARVGFETLRTETRSFNPYVVWMDWWGTRININDMLHETELSVTFKTSRMFAPARIVYRTADVFLNRLGLGDLLLAAARKPDR